MMGKSRINNLVRNAPFFAKVASKKSPSESYLTKVAFAGSQRCDYELFSSFSLTFFNFKHLETTCLDFPP